MEKYESPRRIDALKEIEMIVRNFLLCYLTLGEIDLYSRLKVSSLTSFNMLLFIFLVAKVSCCEVLAAQMPQ